ncbi:MAG: hypothetical protein LBR07_06380 [Puniceicoccales bacterium]|jgi:hypothetical protein|nr:hypothetical protein [Puniceicoccales bacterium]
MQTLTEAIYRQQPPCGVFNHTVIDNLFPNETTGARALLLHRACAAGEVLRLTRGLFVLAAPFNKKMPHPFLLANLLQPDSHVSVESALAFHGLIPEAVYQTASVCTTRAKNFQTPLGNFSYQRVPVKNPRAGVEVVKLADDFWAFVATPLRAIADLVYLTPDITWKRDGAGFLTESLRIEESDVASLNLKHTKELVENFNSRRIRDFLTGLKAELKKRP